MPTEESTETSTERSTERTRERRKRRISIDVSPEFFQDLQDIVASSGSTMTGVFRNALKVYKLIVEEEKKHKSKIIIESKEGKRQLIVP